MCHCSDSLETLTATAMVFETVLISTAAKTIGLVGSTLWLVPLLLAGIYFNYDRYDPEARPMNQRHLHREYDFIVVGTCVLCGNK